MRRAWAWFLAAALLVVSGVVVLVTATSDVNRSSAMAGATPVRVLTPQNVGSGPVVVLAHGFSGSSAMMDPMGSALARAGFPVVMPDLPGHGSNPTPLDDEALDAAVTDAAGFAAGIVGGAPVAVVGHSMGAGAVTSWAVDNPTAATVAISLPSAEDLPAEAARPANLLLLWGSAESARFVDAALAALRLGYPQGEPGRTYGDQGAGDARRAAEVAGAEHISVVYRQQSFDEVATWLSAGVPGSSGRPPSGDARLVGVLLVLGGGVMATRPLLARSGPQPAGAPVAGASTEVVGGRTRVPRRLLLLLGGGVVSALGAAALQGMTDRVPVAVSGYLAGWFAVGSVVLGAGAGPATSPREGGGPLGRGGSLRGLGWGVLAGGVLALAMALPARLSWASYDLIGVRWGVLAVLLVVLGAWFWAEWRVVAGAPGWRRPALLVTSRLIIVAVLLGSIALLGAPGFLALTVPLVIPILLLLALLAGWARDPVAAGAAQALPLALAIATVFPIAG